MHRFCCHDCHVAIDEMHFQSCLIVWHQKLDTSHSFPYRIVNAEDRFTVCILHSTVLAHFAEENEDVRAPQLHDVYCSSHFPDEWLHFAAFGYQTL